MCAALGYDPVGDYDAYEPNLKMFAKLVLKDTTKNLRSNTSTSLRIRQSGGVCPALQQQNTYEQQCNIIQALQLRVEKAERGWSERDAAVNAEHAAHLNTHQQLVQVRQQHEAQLLANRELQQCCLQLRHTADQADALRQQLKQAKSALEQEMALHQAEKDAHADTQVTLTAFRVRLLHVQGENEQLQAQGDWREKEAAKAESNWCLWADEQSAASRAEAAQHAAVCQQLAARTAELAAVKAAAQVREQQLPQQQQAVQPVPLVVKITYTEAAAQQASPGVAWLKASIGTPVSRSSSLGSEGSVAQPATPGSCSHITRNSSNKSSSSSSDSERSSTDGSPDGSRRRRAAFLRLFKAKAGAAARRAVSLHNDNNNSNNNNTAQRGSLHLGISSSSSKQRLMALLTSAVAFKGRSARGTAGSRAEVQKDSHGSVKAPALVSFCSVLFGSKA